MRQKVTKYPGKDLTVITWTGRPESQESVIDKFKDLVFSLTEKHYFDKHLGKKDYIIQVNELVKQFKRIS